MKNLIGHSIRAIDILQIALIMVLLSGCVLPLPIGVGEILEGEEVKTEQLRFLLDLSTRQKVVVEILGEPDVIWEEPKVYVYHWRISDGKLLWAVGSHFSGVGGVAQLSSAYILLIQFDESGKIIRLDRLSMPGFNKYGQMLRDWVSQPVPESLTLPDELLKIEGD